MQQMSFGDHLKEFLQEDDLSASEVARLVGFRSRNSIFRILSGQAGADVKLRFLGKLHDVLGDTWPESRWHTLQESLSAERLGDNRYQSRCAFEKLLYSADEDFDAQVEKVDVPADDTVSLASILDAMASMPRAEIVITGCCDSGLSHLLADRCGKAGSDGRLTIRQYIDTSDNCVTQNILGVLPLITKPWYTARLVEPGSCPEETLALYRTHTMSFCYQTETGTQGSTLIRLDKDRFIGKMNLQSTSIVMQTLDRRRFDLELLKSLPNLDQGEDLAQGAEAFITFTETYRELENDCLICSIKPDVHFNCLPVEVLEAAIRDGFSQIGLADGEILDALMAALKDIQVRRLDNMFHKHKPTHIIYSLPAMERFMRTGVQTDHFFIQRAYTVEERRIIIRALLDAMRDNPWFNVYFLKDIAPELRYEITMYGDKGVLLMDAYSNYALQEDHSDALVTLPAFISSFRSYFLDELLAHHVISRAESIRQLERLLVMDIQP